MATITQLEYIVTVDKLKHFGKAAEACHVSQPSLSAQIQKVEDEIGFTIFDRNRKPIAPTSRGQHFIEQAKAVLHEHAKLLEISKISANELMGSLTIGIIPTVSPYLTPFFINKFAKSYPKVLLKIEELKTEDIISNLKNNEIDAGILATPLNEKSFIETPLYYEDFYLYVSPDHPLASKKIVRESDLDASEFWLLEDGHCFRNQILKICNFTKKSTLLKNISFQGGSLDTLRQLVLQSGGATILPASLILQLSPKERQKHVRSFSAPVPTREISLVTHKNQWKLDLLKALSKCILKSLPEGLYQKVTQKQHIVGID